MRIQRSTAGSQNQHDAARLWVDIIASIKTKVTSTLDSTNCCHAGPLHPTGMPLGCRERDVMRHGIRPIAGRSVKPVLALLLGHDTCHLGDGSRPIAGRSVKPVLGHDTCHLGDGSRPIAGRSMMSAIPQCYRYTSLLQTTKEQTRPAGSMKISVISSALKFLHSFVLTLGSTGRRGRSAHPLGTTVCNTKGILKLTNANECPRLEILLWRQAGRTHSWPRIEPMH